MQLSQKLNKISNRYFFLGICILLVCIYFPALYGEFLGDDVGRIEKLGHTNIFDQLYSNLGDRPLLILSIWVDKVLLDFQIFGMRLENLIIFSLIIVVMRSLIVEAGKYYEKIIDPFWRDGLLVLFAIHPLNTQVVSHVVQRGALLSTLFGLISTLLLMKCNANPRRFYWKLSLLSWSLALLAKPNIAFLPFCWLFILNKPLKRSDLYYLLFFFLMISMPILSYVWGGYNIQHDSASLSSWKYFLVQGSSILKYLKLMILPWPLHFIHPTGYTEIINLWPGLYLWVSYILLLIWILIKSKNIGFKFFLVTGFIAFLPESSFFSIIHPFFEHRTFTAFAFFICAISQLSLDYFRRYILMALVFVIIIFASVAFFRLNQVQTYAQWVEVESYKGACEMPYFNYNIIHELILRGNLTQAKKVIDKHKKCSDHYTNDLLSTEYAIAKSDQFNYNLINPLKKYLHSDFGMICKMRYQVNTFLLKQLEKSKKSAVSCLAEDLFSEQLRFLFFNATNECEVDRVRYYIFSNKCLAAYHANLEKRNEYNILKIRTILYSYYLKEDTKLLNDLKSYLSKDKRVNYLIDLYNSKNDLHSQRSY